MVKLTVIYNLPQGADHEEFIKWRTTVHQQSNMSIPGVIKSDFYVVKGAYLRAEPLYRYITESYFPDMATFEKSFYDPTYQAALTKSLERIAEPVFLISQEIISEVAGDSSAAFVGHG
jgi:EthD domain